MSRVEDSPFGSEAPGPDNRPTWQRQVSQNLADASENAARLQDAWNKRFGIDAIENPLFMRALADAIVAKGALGLFELVFQRGAGSQIVGGVPFATRYRESARVLGTEEAAPAAAVPVGLLFYLNEALDQACEQKQSGETFADVEPIDKLVALGNALLEDGRLSGFRHDLLSEFPSRVEPLLTKGTESAALPVPIELQSFVGKVFRGYKILEPLGRGGYGAVFLAEHPTLPVKRALKIFLDVDRTGPGFEKFREKCLAEARIQSGLKHENIVEIVDVFEDQGYIILVMEYVQGRNLAHLINEKNGKGLNLTPHEILELAIPITRGLSHAHRRGVVHRDIKPENILLSRPDNERPKIADFGLARDLEESGQRHRTIGYLVGTPVYMAPEQIARKAKTYDNRCDFYSLGIVLYELALGTAPFAHEDNFKILEMHEKEAPDPLSLRITDFPEELDRIILTCLEKRPEDRFASAEELLAALEHCRTILAGDPGPSTPPTFARRGAASRRRRVAIAGVLVCALFAAVLVYPSLARLIRRPSAGAEAVVKQDGIHAPSPKEDDRSKDAKEPGRPADSPITVDKGPKPVPDALKDVPSPKQPEPQKQSPPLRELLAGFPVGSADALLISQLMDLFSKYRADLLARRYDGVEREILNLESARKNDYTAYHFDAAKELVRLAADLVQDRWRELSESKSPLRVKLLDGRTAEGTVNRVEAWTMTLADTKGVQTGVEIANLSPEEFLRGRTVAAAEVAYQALSGDAAKALTLATELEKSREKIVLWYPFLVRLARLQAREELRESLATAEPSLARGEKRTAFQGTISRYSEALTTLQALAASEASILGIYPALSREFAEARREGEAADWLLSAAYSRVLGRAGGTEAYPIAATMVLAGFLADMERGHDDLIAKRGWLNYNWELRPDEASVKERTQYWDLLEDDGCVLRDAKGPRRLIMGRPHPRVSEGLVIKYQFESLGEDRASAEWGLTLRREGGGDRYLRFTRTSISLHPFTFEGGGKGEPLATAAIGAEDAESRTHTCVLVPGDFLHVFLDGRLVTNLPKEDTLLPSQPSVAVVHGKLSLRSIWVRKKPGK